MKAMSLLPQLGLAVLHRTTREWGLSGATKRDANGLGGLVTLVAGATLGAGLAVLFSPGARMRLRAALDAAFPEAHSAHANCDGNAVPPVATS
jgi:hypothetical protein